jgi:hypothetical protein
MRTDPPSNVVVAGVLIGLQGLGGVVIAVVLLLRPETATNVERHGEASFLALGAAVVIGFGIALLLGKRGARSPAIVVEILQLGISGYATFPNGLAALGLAAVASCGWVLYLLLNADVRDWALDRRTSQR